jgi:FKBP-type peptidyl-prolyl cis-trans isomerase FkpA
LCHLGLVASVAVATLALIGCSHPAPAPTARENQVDALQVTDLVTGQGAEATDGAKVTVNYTGWLYDRTYPGMKGKEFDSSRKPGGQPFAFVLGRRQVIEGWDQGVRGMKVGGQRRLVIPAALAYGERGAGGVIPPGATLVFEVELLAVEAGSG